MVFCTRTLTALSAEGKHQSCLDLLNAMRDRGLSPTAACYATVMATLERVADWKKAVNLLLQVISSSTHPLDSSSTTPSININRSTTNTPLTPALTYYPLLTTLRYEFKS